jgi:hypothetical protein
MQGKALVRLGSPGLAAHRHPAQAIPSQPLADGPRRPAFKRRARTIKPDEIGLGSNGSGPTAANR